MAKRAASPTIDPELEKALEPEEGPASVSTPEDWPDATAIKNQVSIESPLGEMKFDLRAVSHAENEAIFSAHPHPEPPKKMVGNREESDFDNAEYGEKIIQNRAKRMIATIDVCWKTLPGETAEAKLAWAEENLMRQGDLDRVYEAILTLSGYGSLRANRQISKPVVIADPTEWAAHANRAVEFQIARLGTVLCFGLKAVGSGRMKQINAMTRAPEPPLKPRYAPDGRKRDVAPDPNDAGYMKKLAALSEVRSLMVLESALPFKIPGETAEEKQAWLGKRPAGDVAEIISFVQYDVSNLRARADFTSGL